MAGLAPIAVIGMACRLPGGINSPESFWRFLVEGRNAWGEVPAERWESYAAGSPGHAAAVRRAIRAGSYLEDIAGFDAEFFGVSPREAELMDPQQRFTLEVAWEALEHAGIPASGLAGGDGSVFMGVCCDDYGRRMLESLPRIEAWMGVGSSMCAVSNRVSYVLDLRGPSVTVDTACSASLVAVHQACQALRAGETSLALACGVMLAAGPSFSLVLGAAGAISPDGRSKAFDGSADGYGRGEGCAVLVLKRLDEALRDGDPVRAVIRGSAVCQDGRTDGIMAPSQAAQENMLRLACRSAAVDPRSVDYIEAHGTGTALGDPIEAGAISAVLGVGRPEDRPCLLGSVKTNIGHLESASGVAGLIKTVLAMRHGRIPAMLLPTGLNPAIPWRGSGLRVVAADQPWPDPEPEPDSSEVRPRRAMVANYGYGGTIAGVVLESAPVGQALSPDVQSGKVQSKPYPLSGASEAGVRAAAARLAEHLTRTDEAALPLADLGHTLALRRTHLGARATVVAADRTGLVRRLQALADGETADGTRTDRVAGGSVGPVWVFSGHGAQWPGMGRELLATEPEFARVIDLVEPVVAEEAGFSVCQALEHGELGGVDRIQILIFVVQVGLSAVWRAWGVEPAAVIGHSVGEVAAAVAAGILTLADAARLICRRSALLTRVAGQGAMAMVALPFDDAATRLAARSRTGVSAAIEASPRSTVVSGPAAEVEQLVADWQADGLMVRWVESDVAFHGSAMDPLLADLGSALDSVPFAPARVPVYSTALPDPRSEAARDAAYWVGNLRNPVRFAQAVAAAAADGHRVFQELSAHPVVAQSVLETLAGLDVRDGLVVPSLRRNRPEREGLLDGLGALYCRGVEVDWAVLQPGGRLAELPPRAWQHRGYWFEPDPPQGGITSHDTASHTLLGAPTIVHGPSPVHLWQTVLDDPTRPYPGHHAVLGTEVVPAAVLLTTFLAAAARQGRPDALDEVTLQVPVPVTEPSLIQLVSQDGELRINSRPAAQPADEQVWLTHCHARTVETDAGGPRPLTLAPTRCPERSDPAGVLERLVAVGVNGIGFPWRVDEVRLGSGALLARVTADPEQSEKNTWASLFDAALSVAPLLFPGPAELRMPCHVRELRTAGEAPVEALVAVRLVEESGDKSVVVVDIEIAAPDRTVLARMSGTSFGAVRHAPARQAQPEAPSEAGPDWGCLAPEELRAAVLAGVTALVAGELRLLAGELDVRRPLSELGVDSLLSTLIVERLRRRFDLDLPLTLLWNRPTVETVAAHLSDLLLAARTVRP